MAEDKKPGAAKWLGGLVVLVLAAFGVIQLDGDGAAGTKSSSPGTNAGTATHEATPPATTTPPPATRSPPPQAQKTTPAEPDPEATAASEPSSVMVRGPDGPVDIGPTLERIEKGVKHSHRNDGSTFQNRERRLPIKARGYYREYVHPTPGQRGPGAQRVVLGKEGEIYYTPDHYRSFQRVPQPRSRKE
ncbi:MAG: ribonuclease domain-containing protein [Planctomycetota bacterium]